MTNFTKIHSLLWNKVNQKDKAIENTLKMEPFCTHIDNPDLSPNLMTSSFDKTLLTYIKNTLGGDNEMIFKKCNCDVSFLILTSNMRQESRGHT